MGPGTEKKMLTFLKLRQIGRLRSVHIIWLKPFWGILLRESASLSRLNTLPLESCLED